MITTRLTEQQYREIRNAVKYEIRKARESYEEWSDPWENMSPRDWANYIWERVDRRRFRISM